MASAQDQLLRVATEAQGVLQAEIHSISLAVPRGNPTHLRIIQSTDPQAERILGLEFPTTKGLAGWVCQQQQPSIKNPGDHDARHFDVVDLFAGTTTGDGAILTLPLLSGTHSLGVIQFIKTNGARFEEKDMHLAAPFIPTITQLVLALDDTTAADTATRIS